MLSRKHKSSTGFSPQSSSWKLELNLPPYDSITSQRRGMCLISSLWSLQLSVSVRTDCAHVKNETKSRKVSPIWILSSCPFFKSYIHLGQTSSCAVARVSTINADNGQTFLPGTRYLSNRIHQPRLSRSPLPISKGKDMGTRLGVHNLMIVLAPKTGSIKRPDQVLSCFPAVFKSGKKGKYASSFANVFFLKAIFEVEEL